MGADMGYTRSHSTRENIAGQIMKALLLLLVISQSCHGRPQIGNTEPEQQSIVSLQSGQQQFMTRLLQQIESNTTTNFVLSPHSIHSVFSQLLQGSGGRTKEELESLLGVRASDSLVEQYRILGQGLVGEGFKQANLLAVANSFKPKIEFRTNLNSGFQSDIREFDFGSNSLASVQEINQYVEDVTNQKIKDLLANDDVDGLTRMVLINAVYFKATWQFAFNADESFEAGFNSPEGSVSVQYMSREADVRMLVDQERQMEILELPYEDPNRSMLIVLPNAGTSTQDLVQRLGGLDLASIRTNGKLAKTSIFIPKFKLKFKTYLKQQMEQLGVRDLFAQSANLTGLSGGAPGLHRGKRGGDRGCSSHRSCCGLENCSAEEEGVLRRSTLPLCRLRLRAWRHLVRRQGGQPQQRQRDPDESCSEPRAWNWASQSIRGGLCGLQQDVPGLPQFPGQLKHLQ